MMEYFPNIMVKFTADMEQKLDAVEEGKIDWRDILNDFYGPFEQYLEHADKSVKRLKFRTGIRCGLRKLRQQYGSQERTTVSFWPVPTFRNAGIPSLSWRSGCRLPKWGFNCSAQIKRGRKFYGCDNYPNCDLSPGTRWLG